MLEFPFKQPLDLVWIVGLDGSAISYRCLRLASLCMKQNGTHKLLCVHLVKKGQGEDKNLFASAENECRRAGVFTLKNFGCKTVEIRALCPALPALKHSAHTRWLGVERASSPPLYYPTYAGSGPMGCQQHARVLRQPRSRLQGPPRDRRHGEDLGGGAQNRQAGARCVYLSR